jgi:hypothetical protein
MGKQPDKVTTLKKILAGKESITALLPGQHITVFCIDGVYQVHGKKMDAAEYRLWASSQSPKDTIIVFEQQRSNAPIDENLAALALQPRSKPLTRKEKKRLARVEKMRQEAEIVKPTSPSEELRAVRGISLEEHYAFNEMMYKQLYF